MRDRRSTRTRGGGRGPSSAYRRGQNSRGSASRKSTFKTSRIEDQVDKVSTDSEEVHQADDDFGDPSGKSSSDEEAAGSQINPYNVLLQSLNAGSHVTQPERKKRKVTQIESTKSPKVAEQDRDLVTELEDSTNIDMDELIDHEEPDEIREGRNLDSLWVKLN